MTLQQHIQEAQERFENQFTVKNKGETGFIHHKMASEKYANPGLIKSFLASELTKLSGDTLLKTSEEVWNEALAPLIEELPDSVSKLVMIDKVNELIKVVNKLLRP